MDVTAVNDGDKVHVSFVPPYVDRELGEIHRATGVIMRVAGFTYLKATSHRTKWHMPQILDLGGANGSIELIATGAELRAERAAKARGEVVFSKLGNCASDLMAQLDELAEMIAAAEAAKNSKRKDELIRQFDDIADHVSLAKRKRTYVLQRVVVGADFHPWLTRDPRIMRIETVRPLPADFEPKRAARIDRSRRLAEAVSIFGEAEQETRRLASGFRAAGYHVRRPHPNAQELLLRFTMGPRSIADVRVSCSANGFWSAEAALAENKTRQRAKQRLLREGHLDKAQQDLVSMTACA
jgi:hypothetical protein